MADSIERFTTAHFNPSWVLFYDRVTGNPYFYNIVTHATAWEDPEPDANFAGGVRDSSTEGDDIPDNPAENGTLMDEVDASILVGLPPYISTAWRCRNARQQAKLDSKSVAYREGEDSFNLWYHKYTSDRFDTTIVEPAESKCDPWADAGLTRADQDTSRSTVFCIWFAKGACSRGAECAYRHRVPTRDDDNGNEQMYDIFGRKRHAEHKDDMGGVGSFLKDCRCLYISELVVDRDSPDAVQRLEAQLWRLFHPFGPIESIRVIPNKAIAFIKYEYRSAAEFAKVACANQPLGLSRAINVRWAFEDPNPRAAEQANIDNRTAFYASVERRIAAMSSKDREKLGLIPQSRDRITDQAFIS